MWIPHSQVVWIGGELTRDLGENGTLEIELEDGNVSIFLNLYVSLFIFLTRSLNLKALQVFKSCLKRYFSLDRKLLSMFRRINQSYLP